MLGEQKFASDTEVLGCMCILCRTAIDGGMRRGSVHTKVSENEENARSK